MYKKRSEIRKVSFQALSVLLVFHNYFFYSFFCSVGFICAGKLKLTFFFCIDFFSIYNEEKI